MKELFATYLARQGSSLTTFFDRAPFIKRYLSLHQLRLAINECADDDLRAVQRDLCFMREMALMIRKVIAILTSEVPAEYRPERAGTLRSVLGVGGLLVLADLSLRRNGFGHAIDYFLPAALKEFREGLTEEVERQLVEVSKFIPDVIETSTTMMMNIFTREA